MTVTRSRRDDEFRAFFEVESERLERFATMLVGDPLRGAELSQEAMVRIYAHWGRTKHGSPWAYARQIVVNLVRSAHRSKKLRALKPVPPWAQGHEAKASPADEGVGDRIAVIGALDHLSPIRRAVLLLRFYEDLSEAEISRVLDRPLGTIKSDIHRALRQLKPLLEGADTGERRT